MTNLKTTIAFIVVIFFTLSTLFAQTTPLEHRVVKGDNVYRLSLRYGVSMEAIFDLNPGSRAIIKIGEIVFIPNKKQSSTIDNTITTNESNSNKNANTDKFQNYVVSKGETKFGISKKFDISINVLEEANPSIVKMLLAGQTIQIPNKSLENKTPINTNAKVTSHTVKKGETLWAISQRYNMRLAELTALNESKLGEFLQIGQILAIQNDVKTDNDDTYIVAKGDTKFGLSKRFNISISKLEQLNPDIVPMLKYGTRITTGLSKIDDGEDLIVETEVENVDDSENTENLNKTKDLEDAEEESITKDISTTITDSIAVNPKQDFIDYTIKPKETLYGLAKQANMSIDDFLKLNPSLKESVRNGSIIKMPAKTEVSSMTEQDIDDSSVTDKNKVLSASVIWEDSSNFFSPELKKQKSGYYLGLQKAIDSIGKLYPTNNLQIENYQANKIQLNDSLTFDTPHIFLYPIEHFNQNINTSADIDILSLKYKFQDSTKEFTLKGLPTEDDMRSKVLSYLKEQNAHILCIYDEDHAQYKDQIKNSLPETNFIATRKNGSFRSNELKSALQSDIKNYVIIESDKVGVFLNSTNILLKELSNTNIQLVVLNPKNIPSDAAVENKRFKILKLLYPQPYNSEISKGLSTATALGFAINFDVLERLFTNGFETFDTSAETSVFGFSFRYVLNDDVYENKSVMLFVYDENSTSTQIDKK